MSTVKEFGDSTNQYSRHSLRLREGSASGRAEGHVSRGLFELGALAVTKDDGTEEDALLLTVASEDDPDRCIEIVLNRDDFTAVFLTRYASLVRRANNLGDDI
jgi:hypothetical protein